MAFIVAGYFFEVPSMTVVGLSFLFMLGIIILSTGIEYKTGEVLDETGLTTTISYTYSTFTHTTYGIFICVIAVFWFVAVMLDLRGNN